jgi:hypothetical protein
MGAMLWSWLVLSFLGGCSATPGLDSGRAVDFEHPLDDLLRVSHLQAKGTHNSYHQDPGHDAIDEWAYSHAPLAQQAACQGVRQFELDVHQRDDGGFDVLHVPVLDPVSSCETLRDCLGALRSFSDASPGHHPLFVMVEPKNGIQQAEAEGYLAELEAAVVESWPDRLLSPDLVQGEHPDLPTALLVDGWPTLGEVRGHLLLWLLDSGALRDSYTHGGTSLAGRAMFVRSDPGDPFAAVMMRDDPTGSFDEIQELVRAGYLIRTRSDSGGVLSEEDGAARRDTAIASGATMVSTDYPAPVEDHDYWLQLPEGSPSRCNPLTAPTDCTSEAIEDPRAIDHRPCWAVD